MSNQVLVGGGYLPGEKGSYAIYRTFGHYSLYINGEFWSSGDSYREIEDELEEWGK